MERFELSQDLGFDILSKAKAKGATEGDVVMAESESFFVTVRMGEVEKISQAGEKRLGLRLFFGNSSASASTSDISQRSLEKLVDDTARMAKITAQDPHGGLPDRSEEHTSELQSHVNLVCRLLLEKKKKMKNRIMLLQS